MTFTYTLSTLATTPKDQVRLLLQDTVSSGHLLEDEEIAWALTAASSTLGAAANLAEALGAGGAGIVLRRVGDVEERYDAAKFRQLAAALRAQAAVGAIPKAGGISRADKQVAETDTDATQPMFSRSLHTVPGVATAPYTPTWPADGV